METKNPIAGNADRSSETGVLNGKQWYGSKQEIDAHDKGQRDSEQVRNDSLIEDLVEDFYLPINQKPTENVDLDNVEQASLDTMLTSSNIGFRLLQKMGWKGKGLGKDEQGITEPIKSGIRDPKLGIGKQEEDDFFTAEENIQRKKLEIELEETTEHAKKREVLAEREQKILTEVKEIRKVFYCDLCNKQYKLAMEFEVHLSSYDHNHRKRFKEMREMQGSSSRDDRQKRELQRQEREMIDKNEIWFQRFKEMREMQGSSSRDDRQKRELQRQEREMAKFAQMADARKQQQQQQQQQQQEEPQSTPISNSLKSATALADQEQRKVLKFGFSSKTATPKKSPWSGAKKPKVVAVASVFGNEIFVWCVLPDKLLGLEL
ncbi:uncharacterized protein [Euphorbia lathyris]|uniref:uncharacterized protein n=1 Tax=Euphorbia lathyris TaxID=212925 RepID=UPI00331341DC